MGIPDKEKDKIMGRIYTDGPVKRYILIRAEKFKRGDVKKLSQRLTMSSSMLSQYLTGKRSVSEWRADKVIHAARDMGYLVIRKEIER